jgi:hypothetical protein
MLNPWRNSKNPNELLLMTKTMAILMIPLSDRPNPIERPLLEDKEMKILLRIRNILTTI